MDAKDIVKSLEKRHRDKRRWALFIELRLGTGYVNYSIDGVKVNPEQRMDAWALDLYPSSGHIKVAYEIKISRGDFLKEIKNPEKRQSAMLFSNLFYFVTPKGLVDKSEIPKDTGLIEVNHNLNSRIIVEAPFREDHNPSWNFLATISRRVQDMEVQVEQNK